MGLDREREAQDLGSLGLSLPHFKYALNAALASHKSAIWSALLTRLDMLALMNIDVACVEAVELAPIGISFDYTRIR